MYSIEWVCIFFCLFVLFFFVGLVWWWIVVEMERSKICYVSMFVYELIKNWWVGLFCVFVRVYVCSWLWMVLRNFKINNLIKSYIERMYDVFFLFWYYMILSRIEKLFDNVCVIWLFFCDKERNELFLYLVFDVWKCFFWL